MIIDLELNQNLSPSRCNGNSSCTVHCSHRVWSLKSESVMTTQKRNSTRKVLLHLFNFIDTTGLRKHFTYSRATLSGSAGLRQQTTVRLIRSTEGFPLRR